MRMVGWRTGWLSGNKTSNSACVRIMVQRMAPGFLQCCQQTLFGYFIGLQCVYVYEVQLCWERVPNSWKPVHLWMDIDFSIGCGTLHCRNRMFSPLITDSLFTGPFVMTALIYSVSSSYSVFRRLGMEGTLLNGNCYMNHDTLRAVNKLRGWKWAKYMLSLFPKLLKCRGDFLPPACASKDSAFCSLCVMVLGVNIDCVPKQLQLVFQMETYRVFFAVGTEFLNFILMNFRLQACDAC
jgi:hypothetical protein